jgi:two-component system cell cycle response regulator DivK
MKEKILIVEDNLINRKVIRAALEPHGYTLIEAIDGEEALEVAIKEKPDLVIMDMQLPKLSGLEVTKKLRQIPAFAHVPILAVTAYAMKGDSEMFIEAGCDAYLAKPVNTRELPGVVAELLLKREQTK